MNATLAATNGGAVKLIQSVPLIVFYLVTVAAVLFGAFKMGDSTTVWHKLLVPLALILGMFVTAAIPKASAYIAHAAGTSARVYVVGPMVILAITALIMIFVENKSPKK